MSQDNETPFLDSIVDDLVPNEIDWRHVVTNYPIPSLLVAAVGGFLVGREQGRELIAAGKAFVTEEVTHNLNALLDRGLPSDDD